MYNILIEYRIFYTWTLHYLVDNMSIYYTVSWFFLVYNGYEMNSLELINLQMYAFSTNPKWESDGFNLYQTICHGFV